mgnify:CR=1 FL=1
MCIRDRPWAVSSQDCSSTRGKSNCRITWFTDSDLMAWVSWFRDLDLELGGKTIPIPSRSVVKGDFYLWLITDSSSEVIVMETYLRLIFKKMWSATRLIIFTASVVKWFTPRYGNFLEIGQSHSNRNGHSVTWPRDRLLLHVSCWWCWPIDLKWAVI